MGDGGLDWGVFFSYIPPPSRVVRNWSKYLDLISTLKSAVGGGAFGWVARISGELDMNNNGKIVQLLNPTNNQDAATKSYVDTKTTDMATSSSVSSAITTALGSSGTQANWSTVQRDDTTSSTRYLTFIDSSDIPGNGSSKRALMRTDADLYYNPNVNTLYAGTFSGTATYATSAGSATTAENISKRSDSTFTVDGVERMRITSAGNVGIGTNSPATRFHVVGNTQLETLGIGTSSPQAPLHITNWSDLSPGGTGFYWNLNAGSGYAATHLSSMSIITNQSILIRGSHIWITSDQRIKKNITSLNVDKMINIFRTLRPISFDFIDPMKNSNKKHFGFIAQEVNEILPEGISLNTDVIPNNMKKADISKISETDETPSFTLKPDDTDITLQYLLLTTDSPLFIDISNSYSSKDIYKFKVYCGKEWTKEHDIYIRSDYNVTDDKYTYVIGMKKEVYDVVITESTLFVYGQYVYDLHILDQDTIYTVATAALQEVDRQQQADKARIAELEATVAAQQSLINNILERLKTLEKA